MSLIRFSIRDKGLIDKAAQVGYNTGLARVKSELYERALKPSLLTADPDELLSLDNQPSEYVGASAAVKRSNIILEVDADLTTTPDRVLRIELIDVKCRVNQSNTIVSTALVGRRGSVKEYIQANDYRVDIRGSVVANSQNAFPLEDVITLKKILATPGRIRVYSKLLQLFEITHMVYQSGDYDQDSARYVNAMPFSFQFLSDDDYELEVL